MAVQINLQTLAIHSGQGEYLTLSIIILKAKFQFKIIYYTINKIFRNTFYYIVNKKEEVYLISLVNHEIVTTLVML